MSERPGRRRGSRRLVSQRGAPEASGFKVDACPNSSDRPESGSAVHCRSPEAAARGGLRKLRFARPVGGCSLSDSSCTECGSRCGGHSGCSAQLFSSPGDLARGSVSPAGRERRRCHLA